MAAHQAFPSLGFSRQEYWSRLPFPSPMHESESEVAQSCPTLRDPMYCSLPGSSVHGIFQARVLEWGAIAFSDSDSIHWDRMSPFLLFCYFLKTSPATFRILTFRNLSTFELSLWVDCSLLGGKALCFVHFFITFVDLNFFFPLYTVTTPVIFVSLDRIYSFISSNKGVQWHK